MRTWVFVEHAGPWGARPPGDTPGLPEAVKAHLASLGSTDPELRVQLVRRPETRGRGEGAPAPRPWVMVVRVDPHDPGRSFGVERRLGGDEELLTLAPDEELSGRSGARRLLEPRYFVCVHGNRDRCCAKWGMPVFRALATQAGEMGAERVWQVSHLGGHRFAPVVLTLPDGFMYGRLGPEDAAALWRATESGMLPGLAWLRGRTCLEAMVQVAEHHLRARHGFLGHNDLSWIAAPTVPAGPSTTTTATARFAVTGGELSVDLELRGRGMPVLGSCGDAGLKDAGPRWEVRGS